MKIIGIKCLKKQEEISKENQVKLIVDATCVPADIRYLTGLSLLNEGSKAMLKIDGFCEYLPVIPTRLLNRPHVRPIVRGKAGKRVEFGAKISLCDGF